MKYFTVYATAQGRVRFESLFILLYFILFILRRDILMKKYNIDFSNGRVFFSLSLSRFGFFYSVVRISGYLRRKVQDE